MRFAQRSATRSKAWDHCWISSRILLSTSSNRLRTGQGLETCWDDGSSGKHGHVRVREEGEASAARNATPCGDRAPPRSRARPASASRSRTLVGPSPSPAGYEYAEQGDISIHASAVGQRFPARQTLPQGTFTMPSCCCHLGKTMSSGR